MSHSSQKRRKRKWRKRTSGSMKKNQLRSKSEVGVVHRLLQKKRTSTICHWGDLVSWERNRSSSIWNTRMEFICSVKLCQMHHRITGRRKKKIIQSQKCSLSIMTHIRITTSHNSRNSHGKAKELKKKSIFWAHHLKLLNGLMSGQQISNWRKWREPLKTELSNWVQ